MKPTVAGIDVGSKQKGFHAVSLNDGEFFDKTMRTRKRIYSFPHPSPNKCFWGTRPNSHNRFLSLSYHALYDSLFSASPPPLPFAIPDTFITLINGQVGFTLAGAENYKLSIDSGNFRSFTGNAEKGNLSPQFYLEVA